MPNAVQLPALSPTMSEGRITKWLKQEGDTVNSGDALAECETDKSNLEIEATDSGVLLKIVVPAGATAPVGGVIAWVGKAGEVIPSATVTVTSPAAAPPAPVSLPPPPPAPAPVRAPAVSVAPQTEVKAGQRVRASPLARRMAETGGIDIASVVGSGPNGRVIKADLESALRAPRSAATRGEPEVLPLSSMRKVIAARLTEVKPGVPHFYLTIEVEMDAALKLREEAKSQELKISVNDVLVKAVAVAVAKFPRINQVFAGDKLLQLHTVDVGVAVAIEDGLVTPVVRDAHQKGLAELSQEIRELAARAKKKTLRPEEYSGGSITVSNLGMFGIDSFIAILNPPQAAILAVGKVEPKVVVRDNAMVIRQMMSVTLSGDHRVIDGAVGAQYLAELRLLLEHPLRLLF